MSISLYWNIYQEKKQIKDIIYLKANENFNKDLSFRYWATSHGGVYVPENKRTPSNPYLKNIPERNIITPSGRRLTLMNPAYMMRQLMTEYPKKYGVRGRITSLKPFNIYNKPDNWERKALKLFEQGKKEVSEFVTINKKHYLRLMKPLVTERGCLKCHGYQNYKVGDIRGGIGVLVDTEPFLKLVKKQERYLAGTYTLIWFLGIIGLFISYLKFKSIFIEKEIVKSSLEESNERFKLIIEQAADAVFISNLDGKIISVNKQACHALDYSREELLNKNIIELDSSYPTLKQCQNLWNDLEIGQSIQIVSNHITSSGAIFPVELNITAIKDMNEKLIVGFARDITIRKKHEDDLKNSLEEKDLLLGEIHHRVKNNLQVVSSIINLESLMNDHSEIINILDNTSSRVQAMGLLHSELYRSKDFTHIDMKDYLSSIASQLLKYNNNTEENINISYDIENIYMNIDTAMPCGLIFNEIISNSLNHAFPDQQKGKINVSLKKENDQYVLQIYDDGVGIPENVDLDNDKSLGMQLISMLISQLHGEVQLIKKAGTKYIIFFENNIKEETRWKRKRS